MKIVGTYGPSNAVYKLDFGEETGVADLRVAAGTPPEGVPVIVCDRPTTPIRNGIPLVDLYLYSRQKRLLFDKIVDYKKHVSPGVRIVTLSLPSLWYVKNRSEYENYLLTREKSKQNYTEPYVFPGLGKDAEYAKDVNRGFGTYQRDGVDFLRDYSSTYANCTAGYRVTTDLPDTSKGTIYFFGNSVCWGMKSDDAHTIPSVVQRGINEDPSVGPYTVLNCGNGPQPNLDRMWRSINFHHPGNNDVIVLVGWFSRLIPSGFYDKMLFLLPQAEERMFDRPHDLGDYVYADPVHYTYIGYTVLGQYLARKLLTEVLVNDDDAAAVGNQTVEYPGAFANSGAVANPATDAPKALSQYIESIKQVAPRIGAIVMNCNPFTLGHRYLIEQSARKVSQLIIFVVEEDKSIFPFKDRLDLVKQGTADLSNVTVVPSGGFIISQATFGAYFEKDLKQNATIDPTMDVELFAQHIAPALGITIRFAGEEPLDLVTRQYNDAMQRILPRYGIEFEVIPRKETGGQVISASRVRKLLQTKDFPQISHLVPHTTFAYLRHKFGATQ